MSGKFLPKKQEVIEYLTCKIKQRKTTLFRGIFNHFTTRELDETDDFCWKCFFYFVSLFIYYFKQLDEYLMILNIIRRMYISSLIKKKSLLFLMCCFHLNVVVQIKPSDFISKQILLSLPHKWHTSSTAVVNYVNICRKIYHVFLYYMGHDDAVKYT